ncbi:MAG: hypothetical protein KDK05_02055 [Candidatus Competibacteraceae bacterium]|nr:hypothetical protein [Candidatus Competibacteraceae bacterium]
MITIAGSVENTMPLKEAQERIPRRWLKFFERLVALRKGRYMILLNIGDGDMSWSVADVERVER